MSYLGVFFNESELAKTVSQNIKQSEKLKKIFLNKNDAESLKEKITDLWRATSSSFDLSNLPDGAKPTFDIMEDMKTSNLFSITSKVMGKIDKKAILTVGHKFAYKFKPWQATKLASQISRVVPIINIIGVLWEGYSVWKGKKDAERAAQELREAKDEVQKQLKESASEQVQNIENKLLKPIAKSIWLIREQYIDKKKQLAAGSQSAQKGLRELDKYHDTCLSLYDEIYQGTEQ